MKKVLLLITWITLLSGCAVNIRTTGFLDRSEGTSAPPKGALFAVLENGQAPNPILDREIRSKIEKLLLKYGYQIAAQNQARYILTFSYNINPGLRLGTTTLYSPPQSQIIPVPDGKGGTTFTAVMTPGTTSFVPSLTGIFTKHLTLKVTDARSLVTGQKEKVVWVGDTLNTDESSDLRYDIDYLLVATFGYFGKNTGQQINVHIDRGNPDVKALRKETATPTE